ncbi:MAG: zinc ribbon domain-containing protein [Lachnospiraceae bacterium]|nr:zinc ribbon domain-containing protein [Lachnospiraceae bacterium]
MSVICPSCHAENGDGVRFCTSCGTRLEAVVNAAPLNAAAPAETEPVQPVYEQPVPQPAPAPQPQPVPTPVPAPAPKPQPVPQQQNVQSQLYKGDWNDMSYKGSANGFISDDEQPVATLKNGWVANVISGEGIMKENAVLTNRRLYYNAKRGLLNIRKYNEKVNVEDITGTKIMGFNPIGVLVLSAIFFILGIVILVMEMIGQSKVLRIDDIVIDMWGMAGIAVGIGLLFLILFFVARKKRLIIEYAGGSINFSVRRYKMKNVQEFQSAIHFTKDKALKRALRS